jgi:signal transduction histidine kinase/DNA-binding response OmpR family regulator/ligand-binding sensor domain-containing protein
MENQGKSLQPYTGKYPELRRFREDSPIVENFRTIHLDNKGVLWVSSTKGGLYKLVPGGADFEKIALPPEISPEESTFQAIAAGSENSLWLTSKSRLYRYFPLANRFVFYPQAFPETRVNQAAEEHIVSVLEDRSGTVWVGLELGGIRQLDIRGGGFRLYYPSFLKTTKLLKQYRVDQEGNEWFTTRNEIIRFDKRTGQAQVIGPAQYPLKRSPAGPPPTLSCLFEDRQGNMWIGTNQGLLCWQKKTRRFSTYTHDPADSTSLTDNAIATVYQDEAGEIWVGTGIGVNRFDAATGTFRQLVMEGRRMRSAANYGGVMASLNAHELLIGTGRGLRLYNKQTETLRDFRRFLGETSLDSISKDDITCLYKSSRGQMWVGTSNGLNLFDPVKQRFRSYFTRDGLPNNFIGDILEDDQGFLWISTNKGISRFDPARQTFQNYDKIEGSRNAEFYSASSFKAPSGELFFGSIDGLVFFDPKTIRPNRVLAPVLITDYRIFDKKQTILSKGLAVAYEQNHIGFDFITLNFLNPEKNQYAYRLEGFDRDWTYCGSRRFTNYTNLNPGTYTFRVKAANNDGLWNERGAAVTLTILPPWYRTWWAYCAYIGMLLAGVMLARNAVVKRERLRADLRIRQVEAEKFKELDGLKSRFFANISHEFRTPLTLILNVVKDKMQQWQSSERAGVEIKGQELQVLKRNAGRLLGLIDQLLDLSRLESGRLQPHNEPGELMGFMRYLAASFESLAQSRAIAFRTDFQPENCWSWFDRDKLEKILVNLLSNAFKFTPDGGEVVVEAQATQEATGIRVAIRVQDSGIGIREEELPRIFDRFYQVDAATTRSYEGSGIGLALSKEMVQLYGGSIGVESQPGQGTTFTVRLLLKPAAPEEITSDASVAKEPVLVALDAVAEESAKELEAETVLVVEDNADLRAYLKECLKDHYRVLEAANGRQGLEQGLQVIPDLIISDVMMPEMDGFTLCNKLKTDERTSHIPLILLTAKAGQENKLTGLLTGADDYLVKPFDARELLVRARNLLDSRKRLRKRYQQDFVLQPSGVSLPSTDERFLSRLREAIEKNMGDESFSVELLGEEMAMSRVQLYRKLFALTNQSPS